MPLSVTQRDHETVHWGPDRPSRLRRAAGALGFGRERPARILRAVRPLRPRRAVCHPCALTHVLLPAWSVRHRRDGTEVIIAALLDAAAGQGHRMIAARLAVARPSPRGRDPPAGERGVVRARAAGVRARSPGSGNTLDTLPRGTRSPRWTTRPARGRGFPMKDCRVHGRRQQSGRRRRQRSSSSKALRRASRNRNSTGSLVSFGAVAMSGRAEFSSSWVVPADRSAVKRRSGRVP